MDLNQNARINLIFMSFAVLYLSRVGWQCLPLCLPINRGRTVMVFIAQSLALSFWSLVNLKKSQNSIFLLGSDTTSEWPFNSFSPLHYLNINICKHDRSFWAVSCESTKFAILFCILTDTAFHYFIVAWKFPHCEVKVQNL